MPLTPKQARFVAAYIKKPNGKQAAIEAGCPPTSAESTASRWLRNDKVREAVDKGLGKVAAKLELSAERILRRIDDIAEEARAVADFNAALKGNELLGKHLKLFTDKTELTGANGGPVIFEFPPIPGDD